MNKRKIMKTERIVIDNLKCGGCENSIIKKLSKVDGVQKVSIDATTAEVSIESEDRVERAQLIEVLSKMGYPQQGTSNNLQKAKSYVSCMIGRMDV